MPVDDTTHYMEATSRLRASLMLIDSWAMPQGPRKRAPQDYERVLAKIREIVAEATAPLTNKRGPA